MRASARARVSVHACVRVRVRVCFTVPSASIFTHVCAWVFACVCVERLGASALCGRCGGTAGAGGVNRSAGSADGRACAVAVWCHRPVSRAFAAGRTFTNRTLKAEWASRGYHTSVIDAVSGAIYVIGGVGGGGTTYDVWASTDGGVRPDSVGGGRGVHQGMLRGY
jgi:hypothetical protein